MSTEQNQKEDLIAYCGLYCGNCKQFAKGKCPGCRKNEKATWCKIRKCGIEAGYFTCADCTMENGVQNCKKYNTFISRLIELFFRTDRSRCISAIKLKGNNAFISLMEESGKMSLPKVKDNR